MKEYNIKNIREDFKSKGIFYTDIKLADKLKSFLPEDITEVYDPTCGSGNLLSVFNDEVRKYGQEINPSQAKEAIDRLVNADIATGDTLVNPAFLGKKFKAIIANYPFSIKYNIADINPFDPRFMPLPCLAPESKADYMFIAHILYYLDDYGTAVTLNFPGILYRGNKERKIREWILRNNYIDEVVQIEGGYFVDTQISTALFVFKKNRDKDTVKFSDNLTGKSRDVFLSEIYDNDCNLSVSSYIETNNNKEEIDIEEVNRRLCRIKTRREQLEIEIDRIIKDLEY